MIERSPDDDRGAASTSPGAEPDLAACEVDATCMLRIRGGDQSALAALYDRHGALLYTLAVRIVHDRALAQEVIQDTFLRCWQEAASYDPERGRVLVWLTRMTRNRAIDLLRSRSNAARERERAELPRGGAGGELSIGDPTEEVVLRQFVRSALARLSAAQREVIQLAYFGGLTQTEIALELGEPLGTIKTRIRAAMGELRRALGAGAWADLERSTPGGAP